MEYHPHSGFHYCKLLKYLCYDYGTFINISGINLDGNEYRQVSYFLSKLDAWLGYLNFSVNVLQKEEH